MVCNNSHFTHTSTLFSTQQWWTKSRRFFPILLSFCKQCFVYRYMVSNSLMNAVWDAFAPHLQWVFGFSIEISLEIISLCTIWRNVKCFGDWSCSSLSLFILHSCTESLLFFRYNLNAFNNKESETIVGRCVYNGDDNF